MPFLADFTKSATSQSRRNYINVTFVDVVVNARFKTERYFGIKRFHVISLREKIFKT